MRPVPGLIIFEIVEFGIHPSILITKRIIVLAYNFTAPVCQGSLTVNTPVRLYSLGGTGISFCHLQLRITTWEEERAHRETVDGRSVIECPGGLAEWSA